MLLEPGCEGPCLIELLYDGGLEVTVAKTSRFLMICIGLIWMGLEWRRARSQNAS